MKQDHLYIINICAQTKRKEKYKHSRTDVGALEEFKSLARGVIIILIHGSPSRHEQDLGVELPRPRYPHYVSGLLTQLMAQCTSGPFRRYDSNYTHITWQSGRAHSPDGAAVTPLDS